jgi:hypothetical protein
MKVSEEERLCSEEKKRRKNSEEKKRQAGKDSTKITPGKATVYKTVGRGKEKRAKTCRKGFKFKYLSTDEEENTFCLACCEKHATNEEWVQCTECVMCPAALGVCRKRSPICVYKLRSRCF